ncbi:unnamed protein product, partial [Rotaria sp. Silwood1]
MSLCAMRFYVTTWELNCLPKGRTYTWKLEHDQSLYDSKKTRQNIQQAFDYWAHYTESTFREVAQDEKADFNFAFVSGDHSDGASLNRHGRKVFHTFSTEDPYTVHIYFDANENWSNAYDAIGNNLFLVIAHEIALIFGLLHSNDDKSIIPPFYQAIHPNEVLPIQ